MRLEISLKPEILCWARERVGLSIEGLAKKVGTKPEKVAEWEQTGRLSLAQAEKIAQKTYIPVGYLFFEELPEDQLPLTDFRTVGESEIGRPSANLIDVIYEALRRQEWYKDFMIGSGEPQLNFVGSLDPETPELENAHLIADLHGLSVDIRSGVATWEEALRLVIEQIENSGVLVMRNGIVGNNTHRKLDVKEFRGFAISDKYSPLIFINNRDAKPAQMFTLMHELVHIWLGLSGISKLEQTYALHSVEIERYCSTIAAEILVPTDDLKNRLYDFYDIYETMGSLTKYFKVSSLVILRRLFDLNYLDWDSFRELYQEEEQRFYKIRSKQKRGGGNFFLNQTVRISNRFAKALIESTLEGYTSYRDALRLLGVKKMSTFHKMAKYLGYNF